MRRASLFLLYADGQIPLRPVDVTPGFAVAMAVARRAVGVLRK
jgi:hypothetical protein